MQEILYFYIKNVNLYEFMYKCFLNLDICCNFVPFLDYCAL